MHVVIARDDHTRRNVANQSSHEYQRVDDGHWHGRGHVLLPRTQQQFQINYRGAADSCIDCHARQILSRRVNREQFSDRRQQKSSFRV